MSAALSNSVDGSDVQVAAVQEKCPFYPTTPATAHIDFSIGEPNTTAFSNVMGVEVRRAQAEADYRISFDRSRQKRGPPYQSLSHL
jgi:hypothetical protein